MGKLYRLPAPPSDPDPARCVPYWITHCDGMIRVELGDTETWWTLEDFSTFLARGIVILDAARKGCEHE